MLSPRIPLLLAVAVIGLVSVSHADPVDPFLGRWALTIPGGGAGWLGVTKEANYLSASILWGGGSVVPCASAYMDGDTLVVTRVHEVDRKDAEGHVVERQQFTDTVRATVSGDDLALELIQPKRDGSGVDHHTFAGERIPALPEAPDLSSIEYGEPIELFNGHNLDGWTLTNENQVNGWSADDGLLVNNPVQKEGAPHISYGNLRTVGEFEDFKLTCNVQVEPKGNSGIYLRGIYEVQVMDSYGMERDNHHMGAVYSRITPAVAAEKPAGEWQTFDITLCDRHITVVLNGETIIDNEPLLGCTGGALWPDEFKPGPIYLQGDHTGVKYRNLVLTPILK